LAFGGRRASTMSFSRLFSAGVMAAVLTAMGCGTKDSTPSVSIQGGEKRGGQEDHGHREGPNGGVVFELGKYHAEFNVDHGNKTCAVLVLSGDENNLTPVAVSATEFTLSTKPTKTKEGKAVPSITITLLPADAMGGRASRFVGTDPGLGNVALFQGTVIGLIDGKPSQGEFKEGEHAENGKASGPSDAHGRPAAKGDAKEADVYLKPGGVYTDADIKANGNTTVSIKYKDLKISHDIKPVTGDRLCPITLTKANSDLKWVIGGKTHTFCCPPCVEEFVTLAKTKPEEIKAPDTYIKK
jgi:YHS domain-containing protein